MFKTAIIVSQNSKFYSQKQRTDRLFPLVNAMMIVTILFIDNLFIYEHGYVSFSFYAHMHLTMEKLCE